MLSVAKMIVQCSTERCLHRDLHQHLAEITEVFLCFDVFRRFAGKYFKLLIMD